MKYHVGVLYLTILGFFTYQAISAQSEYSLVQRYSFEIPSGFSDLMIVNSAIHFDTVDSSFQLYFLNRNKSQIEVFSFYKDSVLQDTVINIKSFEAYYSYYVKSADSIFRFNSNSENLELLNAEGNCVKKYSIDTNYTPMSMNPLGLQGYKNSILIGNTSKIKGAGLKEDRLVYYHDINPVLQLSFANNTMSCLPIVNFPESYCNSGNFYYDIFPSVCSGKNDELCVSFGADNHLYLYKDSVLVLEKTVKSKYIDKFDPFDDDKRFDFKYLQSYMQEEPKYKKIIYDPYQSLYYRIVKHKSQKAQDGKMKIAWSVIVLDTDLNILDELLIDPKFTSEIFIPTPFGIITVNESDFVKGNAVISYQKLDNYGK